MPTVRESARRPPSPWESLALRQPPSTQEMLDTAALATMPVPVVGDVAGLASDAYRFATDPESRTLGNAAWASLGMLPFVPFAGATKSVIKDWKWLPEKAVAAKVGATAVPEHVQEFGTFMKEMADKARRQELTPRDLVKSFTITRSSIQRSAQSLDKLRERWPDFPGAGEAGKIRPEGAFSEWLLTPTGKRYLDAAERGEIDMEAIADAKAKLGGFGKENDLVAALTDAVSLPGNEAHVGEMIALAADKPGKGLDEWREWTKSLPGIGPAKSGFIGSMLGRGDLPTLDARQILIQTGNTTADAQPYLRRKGGLGADQAVDRLAARQQRMQMDLPSELEPFRQHLTHHTIWDAYGGTKTTHEDLVRAMRLAGVGGLSAAMAARLYGDDEQ